jgi:hypothetical protein
MKELDFFIVRIMKSSIFPSRMSGSSIDKSQNPDITVSPLEILASNLEDAIRTLSPKFKVSEEELDAFRKPSFDIEGKGARYDMRNARFIFGFDSVYDIPAIGEEAAHYIHTEINPIQRRTYSTKGDYFCGKPIEYFHIMNLLEFVGHYGSLVYSEEKGLKPEAVKVMLGADDSKEATVDFLSHLLGYDRAESVFLRYGDSMLSYAARLSFEESKDVLPRLAPTSFYERSILPIIDRIRKKRFDFV